MTNAGKTLVLAGAREAHGLVAGLFARGRQVIASMPEPERGMEPLAVPTRVGAFASRAAMATWIADQNVAAVLDASHPFDNHISNDMAAICGSNNTRYLRLLRPGWTETAQDRWTRAETLRQAVAAVPVHARVFSNTGFGSLPEYAAFQGQRLYLRQTSMPSEPAPFPFIQFVQGTPPYSVEFERALFEDLRITRLICRDVGGVASMSKLLAARSLGLRVLMVDRPAAPMGARVVDSVDAALAWEAGSDEPAD